MADFTYASSAIEERLTALWSTTPVAFENSDRPDIVGADGMPKPWIYCEVVTSSSGIRGAGKPGSHLLMDDGLIQMTVFVLRSSGRDLARSLAESVAAIFDRQVFANDGAGSYVRTWVPVIGPGNPASSENPNGSWWAVAVMVPFEFYRVG